MSVTPGPGRFMNADAEGVEHYLGMFVPFRDGTIFGLPRDAFAFALCP